MYIIYIFLSIYKALTSVMLQHLLAKYGDRILQAIRDLSKGLGLYLDEVSKLQVVNNQNICTASHHLKELTPAKFQAWKMWYEDGLSFQKIAVSLVSDCLRDHK